jgi:hypothetical protein
MSHLPSFHLPIDELDRYYHELHDPEEWRGGVPSAFFEHTKSANPAPQFSPAKDHLWSSLAHAGLAINSFLRAWLSLGARFCLAVLAGLAELDSQFETRVRP